jgi:hypothetical protein
MIKFVAGILVGLLIVFIARSWNSSRDQDDLMPPFMRKAYDQAGVQARSDLNSAVGERARNLCKARLGIVGEVKTGADVIALRYGADKAVAFTQCVVNTMYPVEGGTR